MPSSYENPRRSAATQLTASNNPDAPMPPPTHMVTTP